MLISNRFMDQFDQELDISGGRSAIDVFDEIGMFLRNHGSPEALPLQLALFDQTTGTIVGGIPEDAAAGLIIQRLGGSFFAEQNIRSLLEFTRIVSSFQMQPNP